jgi:hypothetical protein
MSGAVNMTHMAVCEMRFSHLECWRFKCEVALGFWLLNIGAGTLVGIRLQDVTGLGTLDAEFCGVAQRM